MLVGFPCTYKIFRLLVEFPSVNNISMLQSMYNIDGFSHSFCNKTTWDIKWSTDLLVSLKWSRCATCLIHGNPPDEGLSPDTSGAVGLFPVTYDRNVLLLAFRSRSSLGGKGIFELRIVMCRKLKQWNYINVIVAAFPGKIKSHIFLEINRNEQNAKIYFEFEMIAFEKGNFFPCFSSIFIKHDRQ